MNDIQNSLFETMKQFSDYTKNSSNATVTIEAIVKEVVNEGTGEYLIEYLGNSFVAYTKNNTSYSVGDNVCVLVPEGDFSKNKIILDLVSPQNRNNFINKNSNIVYNEISNNFVSWEYSFELSSYTTTRYSNISITSSPVNFAKAANDFLKDGHNIFAFSFSARTSLAPEQRFGGNYGMTLNIPLKSAAAGGSTEVIWKSYTLDVGNMLGDPYHFEVLSPQTIYFTIDEGYTFDTQRSPSIDVFCYDFTQDPSKTNIKDVFLRKLSFYAVEMLSSEDSTGLNLMIKSSEGIYFAYNYGQDKTLTPLLKIDGKATSLKGSEIYWFREDVSIKSNSKDYCLYGGFGWKCLNKKTNIIMNADGSESFDWVTNEETLKIGRIEVGTSARYKCVVIYNTNRVSKIITLKDLEASTYFTLSTPVENNTFIKNTGYIHIISKLYRGYYGSPDDLIYHWQRYDKNGNYIDDEDGFFEIVRYNEYTSDSRWTTEVRFPANKVEDLNSIYCTIKYTDTNNVEHFVGTENITIYTSDKLDYNLTINNDNVLYKYDTNGDSPAGAAYNGPITSKVKSIAPITYTITKPGGIELTSEEYAYVKYKLTVPKSCLAQFSGYTSSDDDNYYFEGYDNINHSVSFPYTLANRYNLSANNSIILTITFNNIVLEKNIIINFLKEGAGGSNGTAYAALIVAGGNSEGTSYPYGTIGSDGVAKKLKLLYNINEGKVYKHNIDSDTLEEWSPQSNRLFVRVYKDSSQIAGNRYTVKWSMFDKATTKACFTCNDYGDKSTYLTFDNTPIYLSEQYCNIVQAEITVTNGNSSIVDAPQIIYAYYPIDFIMIDKFASTVSDLKLIPSVDGGFAEVMYASDGTNPSWDETNSFKLSQASFVRNNLENLAINNYLQGYWFTDSHLKIGTSSLRQATASPDNKYDDGNTKNYVATSITLAHSDAQNVQNIINNNYTIRNYYMDQKTTYQGHLQSLHNFASAYNIVGWKNTLNRISGLLEALTKGKYALDLLDRRTNDLEDYLELQKNYNNIDVDTYCATLLNELNALDTQKALARENLLTIEFYSSLISLSGNAISWSPQIKQEYIDTVGLDMALQLEIYIQDINAEIVEYENYCNAIRDYSTTTYLDDFANFKLAFRDSASSLSSKYSRIQEKLHSYYGFELYKLISLQEILQLFDKIYINTLKLLYDETSGGLSINSTTLAEYDKTFTSYDDQIKQCNDIISAGYRLLSVEDAQMVYIRPVVLYFNRYEMSNINAWDGNKIYTGDNDEFLLAPQVGAGIKEQDNSFTGIIIGQRNIYNNGSLAAAQVGLFGYAQGKQSIFINSRTGASIFGIAGTGGQIVVDPSSSSKKALLYSGNYYNVYSPITGLPSNYGSGNLSGQGLLIDLTTPEIRYGNGNFVVTSDGHITAKGGGSIAGWNINDTQLYATTYPEYGRIVMESSGTGKIYSHSHSSLTATNVGFYLSADGLSIGDSIRISSAADGAVQVGKITTNKHWTISGNANNSYIGYAATTFSSTNLDNPTTYSIGGWPGDVYLGTDGIRLGNKFAVDSNGNLVAKQLIAKGGGSIGGWTIGDTTLSAGGTTFNSDGTVTCHVLNANGSGTIGGWTIGSTTLTAGGTTLNSDGTITCAVLNANGSGTIGGWTIGSNTISAGGTTLNSDGQISCGNLNATGGSIGGWAISGSYLSAGNTTLSSDGTITCNNLTANNTGTIGGLTITANGLNAGGTTFNKNGTITCKKIIATQEGTIGAWTIDSNGGLVSMNGETEKAALRSSQIFCPVIHARDSFVYRTMVAVTRNLKDLLDCNVELNVVKDSYGKVTGVSVKTASITIATDNYYALGFLSDPSSVSDSSSTSDDS